MNASLTDSAIPNAPAIPNRNTYSECINLFGIAASRPPGGSEVPHIRSPQTPIHERPMSLGYQKERPGVTGVALDDTELW
jgi:hypothetical protein